MCSHLFQRVASFLRKQDCERGTKGPELVLISFREWLHSYIDTDGVVELMRNDTFSSLSESGFIPTKYFVLKQLGVRSISSHLFQRVASFLQCSCDGSRSIQCYCSHLFQRVASFLLSQDTKEFLWLLNSSHLFQRVASFLPDLVQQINISLIRCSHLFQRVASFLLQEIPWFQAQA